MQADSLKWRRLLALLMSIALLLCCEFRGVARVWGDDLEGLRKIAKDYKIEIVTVDQHFPVRSTHGTIHGRNADRKMLDRYVCLFVPEFTFYPPDLIKRSQLRRVVLCEELSFADQRRNAIPDFADGTLYLDVSRGIHSKPYLRKVIHHEFFHIIDYSDDGSLYNDDRWHLLNAANFQYGDGGKKVQDLPKTSLGTDEFPGFLNHYSTTGVEEDKAEIFAHSMVDPAYVEERASKDPVLKSKVERMRELAAAFCPDMNEEFWERVKKTKRN